MGILYIVATPIGNLKDITIRALEILKGVDVIACEDTRHTLKLLNKYELKKQLISCRAQNEKRRAQTICTLLNDGKNVAYVSDAGSPSISDPGSALVRIVRDKGYPVVPIPGVSALTALCSVSGFPDKAITFEGFLSPKQGKRRSRLTELLARKEGFVLYESPYRIVKLLEDLADLSPDRMILIGREMTKMYEEFIEEPAVSLVNRIRSKKKIAGEFSLLVSGKKKG